MKEVIVTGASKGIGKATALKLISEGYKVIGISRTHTVENKNYIGISQNLSDLDGSIICIDNILKKYKNIIALVSNAGEGTFDNLENLSDEQIKSYFNLNLISHIIIAKKLIPLLKKKKKGHLIFIGSEAAIIGGVKGTLYSAAKHGLFGFVKSLRLECNKSKVKVSIINAGMVRSNFFKSLNFKPGKKSENAIKVLDMASLVTFLLGTSKNINISDVNIDPIKKVIDFD